LAEVRHVAIKNQARIRFRCENGTECVITEHGIAQLPGLNAVSDINLQRELESAKEFTLEPLLPESRPERLRREDLERMVSAGKGATPVHDPDE
jgi:hypothetical protein